MATMIGIYTALSFEAKPIPIARPSKKL